MPVPKSALYVVACIGLVQSAAHAASCKPADPALAGRYSMRGVMETGSMIALNADGRFAYMLSYGAYDEVAEGCWQKTARGVVLLSSTKRTSFGVKPFPQMDLPRNGSGGLVRRFDARHTGIYVRSRR
ncbi:MAG: hypothetical protein AB7F96_06530 [Beijerinckiaceae bacterium]